MIQSNYTIQILQAEEGHKLTQTADVKIADRIISEKVYLSINDSAKNWKEISNDEAAKIEELQRKLAEQ